MRSRRMGSVAGAVVLLALAAGCGSDSDSPGTEPAVDGVVEVVTGDRSEGGVDEPGAEPVADSVVDAAGPSLPANIWPEEIVDTDGDAGSSLPANIWPEEIVDIGREAADDDAKGVATLAPGVTGAGVVPEGVDSISARVTSADGAVCEVCLWLADDDVSRQRGLMDVTDLGGAVGMAFLWDQPRTGNFFMFQTPTPLSIAWFDDDGSHVGQADMEPCLVENSATCERYTADEPYVLAVEMFGGQLDAIGIGPGSTVELLDLDCA